MRTKDEILKHDQDLTEEGIHDRLCMGRRDLLILEVLIDIRDILFEATWNMRRGFTNSNKHL